MSNKQIYTCPMHPKVVSDKPGMCPECGMKLVKNERASTSSANNHSKHAPGKHAGHTTQMFLRKFWVSLVLSFPIILLHFQPQILPRAAIINLALGSIVFFYGGLVFLRGAWREIEGQSPGMMTLIALAILTAYIYSLYGTFSYGETLFWELSTLITIMLLGHYLEMRAVSGAQSALKELSKLLPDTAELIYPSPTLPSRRRQGFGGQAAGEGVKTAIVPLAELKKNDLVLVRPGGRVPADGVVAEGESEIDESLATGESKPVAKKAGSEVIAATINGDGSLRIRVSKIGEQTFLAGVMRLVAEAQASKSKIQILADKAAFYLTIIAIISGLATLFFWLALDSAGFALERMVAVLVIACPHALGLAIPLVASISTTLAARKGFLVRDRLALEQARKIDIVLFDKTGTLTKGEFGVAKIIQNVKVKNQNDNSKLKILQYAASVNANSEHPIAKAIVKEARVRGIEVLPVKDFQRIPGKGAKGLIGEEEIMVGSEAILTPTPPPPSRGRNEERGRTVIYVLKNKELLGSIALADQIREESREAIKALKNAGLKTAMITGDSEDVATWVASELGINEYYARVLPEDKAKIVKKLQDSTSPLPLSRPGEGARRGGRGRKVAFVGDGVNDAPALTQADLGIAIGAGTNVAIESAGIILVQNDPRDIAKIIRLSKLTYRKMIQNLFWATGYNIVALPLAAGALAFKGITLQPALAALLMSLSTVIVAINAILLKKQKI